MTFKVASGYSALSPGAEDDGEADVRWSRADRAKTSKGPWSLLCLLLCACVLFLDIAVNSIRSTVLREEASMNDLLTCKEPTVRQEWRALSRLEKREYISAVLCFSSLPSRRALNETLYDEFSYLHASIGKDYDHSAAFLPWHRYLLHTYEQVLLEECNYKGHIPYWDWALDWENLRESPIWDSDQGFGGDGNKSGEITVSNGRCIVDGPFTGLKPAYYGFQFGVENAPHCLSRAFVDEAYSHRCGSLVHPEAIQSLLGQPNYESFFAALEDGPHITVPCFVHGDAFSRTSPNDPLFFLHHAQVDRLWWMWQQKNPDARLAEYSGPAKENATHGATLADELHFGTLTQSIKVSEVMSTKSEILCYKY